MSVSHHIGLEIAERSFRFAEIQQQDRQMTILRADVMDTQHDYSSHTLFDLPFDRELARSFIADLAAVYHRHTVYAGSLSIVLPALLPVVCTVPVNKSLTAEERREQFEWECRMLGAFPDALPLHILSHELSPLPTAEQVLLVALPSALVQFLTSICEHLTLELLSIDIDQFVMEHAVRRLYAHETDGNYAVIGMHPEHCSAGRYAGEQYLGCRMTSISYRHHYPAQAVRLLESLPLREGSGTLDQVFIFGAAAELHTVDAVESILRCPTIRCVPLADTIIPDDVQRTFTHNGERLFDAAAAAAMLGLP